MFSCSGISAEGLKTLEEDLFEVNYNRVIIQGPENFMRLSEIRNIQLTGAIKKKILVGFQESRNEYTVLFRDEKGEEIYSVSISDPYTMEVHLDNGPKYLKNNNAYIEVYIPSRYIPKTVEIKRKDDSEFKLTERIKIMK